MRLSESVFAIRRIAALTVAFPFLGGCVAEPQDLAWRKPAFVMEVKAPPETVRDRCFPQGIWQSGPHGRGFAAWVQTTVAYASQLANISPTPTGSHVEMFSNYPGAVDVDSSIVEFIKTHDDNYRTTQQEWQTYYKGINVTAIRKRECLKTLQ